MSTRSSLPAPSGRAEPVTPLDSVQSGFISKELKTLHLVPMTAAGTRRQPILPAETTARNNRRREERGQTGFSSEQGPSGLEGIIGNFRKCWNKGPLAATFDKSQLGGVLPFCHVVCQQPVGAQQLGLAGRASRNLLSAAVRAHRGSGERASTGTGRRVDVAREVAACAVCPAQPC